MPVEERDPHTGYPTIAHEWNGITEINRPVPRVVWIFLAVTVIFSVIYWILMPAWPLVTTYTKGILGKDQYSRLAQDLEEAAMSRAQWHGQIAAQDFAAIQADPALMPIVRRTGRTLFEDNCAVCHGVGGGGHTGFPRLNDNKWLWGGTPAQIAETIRVGINSTHPESRLTAMPAFGADGMLGRQAIRDVVTYVRSLSGLNADTADPKAIAAGEKIFAQNCTMCHGEDGTGSTDFGAPDLTDDYWIYGSSRQTLYTVIYESRQGWMPAWENRLSPVERKILTLYVLELGQPEG